MSLYSVDFVYIHNLGCLFRIAIFERLRHVIVSYSSHPDFGIKSYFSARELKNKYKVMSWTGLDIMEADYVTVKVCGDSFDPCYLVAAIDKQAIFPRLRSEYEIDGLRSTCPQCDQPFSPFEDIVIIQNTQL